jgi:hypothetical protein
MSLICLAIKTKLFGKVNFLLHLKKSKSMKYLLYILLWVSGTVGAQELTLEQANHLASFALRAFEEKK